VFETDIPGVVMIPTSIRSAGQPTVSDGAGSREAARPSTGGSGVGVLQAAAAALPVSSSSSVAAIDPAQAARLTADANRWLAEKGSELTVEFDDSIGRAVFRLVDTQTGALVRQIPSKEMLALAQALSDESPGGALLRTDA
jgi:uncharacterized FlaG/YvyC family protein